MNAKCGSKSTNQASLGWVVPNSIQDLSIAGYSKVLTRHNSLSVQSGDWDLATMPVEIHPKAIYCRQRWEEGLSWNRTIAIAYYRKMIEQHGRFDKCGNLNEVMLRLELLDVIFDQVKKDGRLKTRYDLGLTQSPVDETGGIYMHFGRTGRAIFGGGGFHRFMIARILLLPLMPIQIGIRFGED